jgi:hypothetical protein
MEVAHMVQSSGASSRSQGRLAMTRRFSKELNKGLKNTLGGIPTAARLAEQFNLRAYGVKTISRETARRWKCGVSLPQPGHLQVLIEWLNLSPSGVFLSAPGELSSTDSTVDTDVSPLHRAIERVSASHKLRQSEYLAQAALNSLSPRTAVLDPVGVIIMVNNAWRSHAASAHDTPYDKFCCEGINYLRVCDTARGRDADGAAKMAEGIRAVMRGERPEYALKYRCHAHGDAEQWFIGRALRYEQSDAFCVVIIHEAVTDSSFTEDDP